MTKESKERAKKQITRLRTLNFVGYGPFSLLDSFVSFRVTVGSRRSGGTRKEKGSKVDFVDGV